MAFGGGPAQAGGVGAEYVMGTSSHGCGGGMYASTSNGVHTTAAENTATLNVMTRAKRKPYLRTGPQHLPHQLPLRTCADFIGNEKILDAVLKVKGFRA